MKCTLNTVLAGCCAALVLAIAGGTVFAVLSGRLPVQTQGAAIKSSAVPKEFRLPARAESGNGYIDLGSVRAMTQPIPNEDGTITAGTPLVAQPWLAYPAGDRELHEEISQKKRQITALIAGYFSSLTYDAYKAKSESEIKQELTEQINRLLVLGSVDAVYFNTLIFFE
ncbi:MAG TPA: hypothetical protein IAA30_01470 [Candidatus Treponema faecavium]|nr:hypothetical protein [Candidatus Treponema faecavium]